MGSKGGHILSGELHLLPNRIIGIVTELTVHHLVLQHFGGVFIHYTVSIYAAGSPYRKIDRIQILQCIRQISCPLTAHIGKRRKEVKSIDICRVYVQDLHGAHRARRIGCGFEPHQVFTVGVGKVLHDRLQFAFLFFSQFALRLLQRQYLFGIVGNS